MKNLLFITTLILGSSLCANSQSLEEYLEIGAENNPGLKAKFQEYQSALERIPQASSLPDPLFTFGYFVSPVETRVGPQQAKLGVMQMLPWFGSLQARSSASEATAQVKYELFIQARNEYFLKVKLGYYDLYAVNQGLRISLENLEILKSWENQVIKKFEGGLTGMVDVLRVQMMITELESRIEGLEQEIKDSKEVFNLLLNRDASFEVELDQQLLFPRTTFKANPDSLIRNPSMQVLESRRLAEERLLEADNLSNRPNIGLGFDYVAVGPAIADIPDSGKDAFMPMVSLSLPIYGKKNRAKILERQLSLESLDLYQQDLENKLESELTYSLNSYEDAERDYILYSTLADQADQAIRVLVADYTSANKDFEEVLRMQQQVLRYELALEKSIADRYKAEARLNYIFNN